MSDPIEESVNEILAHPEFRLLCDEAREQGLFQILGIETKETAHTRLLAWLLDPANGSRDGSAIRTFVHAVWSGTRERRTEMTSPLQLSTIDLSTATAEFEVDVQIPSSGNTRRLDVLVHAYVEGSRLPLLVIEYKVNALEGENQTADYAEWTRHRWEGVTGLSPSLVFISPQDRAASKDFVSINYDVLQSWLEDRRWSRDASSAYSNALEQLRRAVSIRTETASWPLIQLKSDVAGAINVLRRAADQPGDVPSALRQFLNQYHAACAALGIVERGRARPGDSYWVVAVDATLRGRDSHDAERWEPTGGGGQLQYWDLLVSKARKQTWKDEPAIWAGLWMGRPSNGHSLMEYYFGSEVRDLQRNKFAQRMADKLREWLETKCGVDPSLLGRSGTRAVMRMDIPLDAEWPNGEENEADVSKQLTIHGDAIHKFVESVEQGVQSWLETGELVRALEAEFGVLRAPN